MKSNSKKLEKMAIAIIVAAVLGIMFCFLFVGCSSKESEGLEFQMNEDHSAYVVTGLGSCTDKNIVIPKTYAGRAVTEIGTSAFRGCIELRSVTIPDSVKKIGWGAFGNCKGLTSVTIPDSVTNMGACAFENCSGLTSVTYQGTVAQWKRISKGVYWKMSTGEFTVYCTDGEIAKSDA